MSVPCIIRRWRLKTNPLDKYSHKELGLPTTSSTSIGYVIADEDNVCEMTSGDKISPAEICVRGNYKEWSTFIPDFVFDVLWPLTEGRRIYKIFYAMELEDDCGLFLHVYEKNLKGLIIFEGCFADEDDSKQFKLPDWAKDAVEVTGDERYLDHNLAVTPKAVLG